MLVMRIALGAAIAELAAAGLGKECMKGLQLLQGANDAELAARCRAAFAPEVCRQARQSLGPQPWTSAHLKASCASFESAFEGSENRALEDALTMKAASTPQQPGKLDTAVRIKDANAVQEKADAIPAPDPIASNERPEPLDPQGPVASLMDKLKKATDAKDATASPEKEGQGPVGQLLDDLKSKREESEAGSKVEKPGQVVTAAQEKGGRGPVAQLVEDLKSKREEAEARGKAEKPGQVANVRKMMDMVDPVDPLDSMLKKIKVATAEREAAEAKGQYDSSSLDRLLKNVQQLNGEATVHQPASSSLPIVLASLSGVAAVSAVTLLLAARRIRPSGLQESLQDAEQAVE